VVDIRGWIRDWHFKKFLNSTSNAWLLWQEGKDYSFKEMAFDESLGAYFIEDDEGEKLYLEDEAGRMGNLEGKPLGLASSQGRPIVNIEDAEHATAFDDKRSDKPPLQDDDHISMGQVRESLQVAHIERGQGQPDVEVINPFFQREDNPQIVDLRPTFQLFRRSARPDTPRKAAKNAVEAERAKSGPDLGQIGFVGTIFGAFLLGAITVEFIAGGGGGGVPVPIILDMMTML
jgi:hypothetical protein